MSTTTTLIPGTAHCTLFGRRGSSGLSQRSPWYVEVTAQFLRDWYRWELGREPSARTMTLGPFRTQRAARTVIYRILEASNPDRTHAEGDWQRGTIEICHLDGRRSLER